MFGPPSHALASLLVVCLLRVCKNFSVLQGEILFGRAIYFLLLVEQPVNTCNAVCDINHWHRLFHIFLQHRLIGVAKTQGNSQGFFHQTRRDFAAIPGWPWILLLVNCLVSAFGKRCSDSARAFALAATDAFLACGVDSHFVKSICTCIMVVLTIVAGLPLTTIEEKPAYIRLPSCSIYNSWYNLKVPATVVLINPDTSNWPNSANFQQSIIHSWSFGRTT